jgi:NSS family neurotransmitter:Na+ symporter
MGAPTQSDTRGQFGSRIGFILAAAGSAIGLGNIWRFPYTAGENGGGAFVLIYLAFVGLIGVPVLLAELSMGRSSQRNPVGAFRALVPSKFWPLVGGLGVLAGFAILSFYSVVAGWTFGYIYKAFVGELSGGLTAEQSTALFEGLIGNPGVAIGLSLGFLTLTVLVVRGGVHGGIERAAKILMPLFFLLLVVLAIRANMLEGAGKGRDFIFQVDFSKIDGSVVVSALGQALFSLSLGMGAMITYGSYLSKSENLPFSGITVAVFDTMIALLAGLIVFPALFAAGVKPTEGAGLVFVVVPTILDSLPFPSAFGVAFYSLLGIAALTSTISLLEVVVAYFVDERGWKREKAVWWIGGGAFLLSIPSALGNGAVAGLSNFIGSNSFLDVQNILFGDLSLGVGALMLCIFVGWAWGVPKALEEIGAGGHRLPASGLWGVLVRFVCPLAVAAVLISSLLDLLGG